jgi:electron transport complex protein RnfD
MFLGMTGGSMGETSAAAIPARRVFLIYKGIISPAISVSFLGTMAVYSLLAGGTRFFKF